MAKDTKPSWGDSIASIMDMDTPYSDWDDIRYALPALNSRGYWVGWSGDPEANSTPLTTPCQDFQRDGWGFDYQHTQTLADLTRDLPVSVRLTDSDYRLYTLGDYNTFFGGDHGDKSRCHWPAIDHDLRDSLFRILVGQMRGASLHGYKHWNAGHNGLKADNWIPRIASMRSVEDPDFGTNGINSIRLSRQNPLFKIENPETSDFNQVDLPASVSQSEGWRDSTTKSHKGWKMDTLRPTSNLARGISKSQFLNWKEELFLYPNYADLHPLFCTVRASGYARPTGSRAGKPHAGTGSLPVVLGQLLGMRSSEGKAKANWKRFRDASTPHQVSLGLEEMSFSPLHRFAVEELEDPTYGCIMSEDFSPAVHDCFDTPTTRYVDDALTDMDTPEWVSDRFGQPSFKSICLWKKHVMERVHPGFGQWYESQIGVSPSGEDTVTPIVHEAFRVLHHDAEAGNYLCQSTSMMGSPWEFEEHAIRWANKAENRKEERKEWGDLPCWADGEITPGEWPDRIGAMKGVNTMPRSVFLTMLKDISHTLPIFVIPDSMVTAGSFREGSLGFGDLIVIYTPSNENTAERGTALDRWADRIPTLLRAVHGADGVYDVVINLNEWKHWKVRTWGISRDYNRAQARFDKTSVEEGGKNRMMTPGEIFSLATGLDRLTSTLTIGSDTPIPDDDTKPHWVPTHKDSRPVLRVDHRTTRMGGWSNIVRCHDCNGRVVIYTDRGEPKKSRCPHCKASEGLVIPEPLNGAGGEADTPTGQEEE